MSLSDRRRYPRFPFHSRATLLLTDLEFNGTLIDISLAGSLFAIDRDFELPPGAACRLALYHHRRQAGENIRGTVAYCADHLIGIEFPSMDDAVERELRQLIDLNLASPRLLERDLPALLR